MPQFQFSPQALKYIKPPLHTKHIKSSGPHPYFIYFLHFYVQKKVTFAQNSLNRKFLKGKKKSSLEFKTKNIRLDKKQREERERERAYHEREKAPKNYDSRGYKRI